MRRFACLLLPLTLAACEGDDPSTPPMGPQPVVVQITNISDTAMITSGFSPGAWALHVEPDPFFTAGQPAPDNGLEQLAEDGIPDGLADGARSALAHGVFAAEGVAGANYENGPLHPGESWTVTLEVDPATAPRLSLAMMLGESNDLFLASEGVGIALVDDAGALRQGADVSDMIHVWDAGTEVNQPIGEGADQAPRQPVRGAGMHEDLPVQRARDLPAGSALVQVILNP